MQSINTNIAALQALRAVNAADRELQETRRRISTGLLVGSAKDNGSTWAIAQNMRAEVSSLHVVNESLARTQSGFDVAASAATAIGDLLKEAKQKALSYQDSTLDETSKAAIKGDIETLIVQIDRQAKLAEFNGLNLLTTTGVPGTVGRTVTEQYALTSSSLTPQSFLTPMQSLPPGAGVSRSMQTSNSYALPYSPLTPGSFATGFHSLASGTTATGDRSVVGAGTGTVIYPQSIYPTPPTSFVLPLDLFTDADVVEVWQAGVRLAATGQPAASGGAAVGAGVAVTGQQVLTFDVDRDQGDISVVFNGGVSAPGSVWAIDRTTYDSSHGADLLSSPTLSPAPPEPLTPETSGALPTNGTRTVTLDGGSNIGRVDMLFDAFTDPDTVEVWQGGVRVAATGQAYLPGGGAVAAGSAVDGQHVLSFDYNPANGQALEFRINESPPKPNATWIVGGLTLQPLASPVPSSLSLPQTTVVTTTSAYDPEESVPALPPLDPEKYASDGGVKTYVIDGGTNAGRVDMLFDAYNNADVVEVWQNGVRVAASGQPFAPGPAGAGAPVTGQSTISFDYDPANGQALEFRFNEGSVQDDSAWVVGSLVLQTGGASAPSSASTANQTDIPGIVWSPIPFLGDAEGGSFPIKGRNLTASFLNLTSLNWSDPATVASTIEQALATATEAATHLGRQQAFLESRQLQNSRLADALDAGVGNMVDADLAKEAAKLQAGQAKQQLAQRALAIANAAPRLLLKLFQRGE